jgi:hypothetical protein
MPEYDSPWKEALDAFLRLFLQMFFLDIERIIDWSVPPESLDNELARLFPGAAIGKRFVDRLFKVRLLDQSEVWLLIHIEVQTQYEADFPERVFYYYIRLKVKFALPLSCLVVLADTRPNWRPDTYKCEFARTKIQFSYPVVKLADYRDRIEELERSDNLFALIVLAHLQSQSATEISDRLEWKRRITQNLLERNLDEERSGKVLRLVDWMLELPVELNEVFWSEMKEWSEGKAMPYVTGLEKMLMKKGIQRGRKQGLKAGRTEGERAGFLAGLELALELKFKKAGKSFFAELKEITDVSRLRALHEAIRDVATIAELRKML